MTPTERLALYEAALRKIQQAAAGYIHPERRVSAEQLIDVALATADDQQLVRALADADNQDGLLSPTEGAVPPATP